MKLLFVPAAAAAPAAAWAVTEDQQVDDDWFLLLDAAGRSWPTWTETQTSCFYLLHLNNPVCVVRFFLVARSKYSALARAPPAEAEAWPQFARRIAEERPDDWFVLLDVASKESGIVIANLLFFAGSSCVCDASY